MEPELTHGVISVRELATRARFGGFEDFLGRWLEAMAKPISGSLAGVDLKPLIGQAGSRAYPLAVRLAVCALSGDDEDKGKLEFLEPIVGRPLTAWAKARWIPVPVPCLDGSRLGLVTLLAGHSASILPPPPLDGLLPASLQAVDLAVKLAEEKWGGHGFAWNFSAAPMDGESLGLPLFLGISSAAKGQSHPLALASGRLLPDGRIAGISGAREKYELAGKRAFFIPSESYDNRLAMEPGVVPVDGIDEAWALWEGCGAGLAPKPLMEILAALRQPERLFSRLPDFSEAEWRFLDTSERREMVYGEVFRRPESAEGLERSLGILRASKRSEHQRARAFLSIFDSGLIEAVGAGNPSLAWRLAVLRGQELSRWGDGLKARSYFDLARSFESGLGVEDEPDELIAGAISILVASHDLFDFYGDYREMAGPRLMALFEARREVRNRRIGEGRSPRDNVLGDFCGAIGQHLAFQGDYEEAERFFGEALACFNGQDDRRQTMGYLFFNALEAGNRPKAKERLEDIWGGRPSRAMAGSLQAHAKPWACFALARYQVEVSDAGDEALELLEELSREIAGQRTAFGVSANRHPWQLATYNLGLISNDAAVQEALWKASLEICQGEMVGTAMRAMALLPLSALHRAGLGFEGAKKEAEKAVVCVRESLCRRHFQALLDSAGFAEALGLVARRPEAFFPFNYR